MNRICALIGSACLLGVVPACSDASFPPPKNNAATPAGAPSIQEGDRVIEIEDRGDSVDFTNVREALIREREESEK